MSAVGEVGFDERAIGGIVEFATSEPQRLEVSLVGLVCDMLEEFGG